jgi:hypothetical protein
MNPNLPRLKPNPLHHSGDLCQSCQFATHRSHPGPYPAENGHPSHDISLTVGATSNASSSESRLCANARASRAG